MDDPGAAYFVFQAGEPRIEFVGSFKVIHTRNCIHLDTFMQS